jgi:hypothetical protein
MRWAATDANLALDFSSGPLTNFKGAFYKIPCGHSQLKVMTTPETTVGLVTVSNYRNILRWLFGVRKQLWSMSEGGFF